MKEVLDFCTDMDKVAEDFISHLNIFRNPQNEIVDLEKQLFKWSMESIGTFLFDSRFGALGPSPPKETQDFVEHLQGFFKQMQPLMFNFPFYKIFPTRTWKQFEKHADNIFKLGRSFVDNKAIQLQQNPVKEGEKSSFIEYMMNQKSLTQNEALSTVVDMLISATETTSSATMWALYSLANNPEAQEKLYEETKRVLPNNETITPEKLPELQYVRAVVKELYPITFATTRYLRKDTEIAGYLIPAGIVQNFRLEYNHSPVGAVLNTVMTPDQPLRISFIPRN
uniref:Cytochrome P450 10 n=1 Tax=Magallana gigas TaxID=29159 RepID=K1RVD6_MAGGI